jgi:hypothetical protein
MTHEELDALPIANGFKQRMLPNGITENYKDTPLFLVRKDDDFIAIGDREGRLWQTGWSHEGVQYKERSILESILR